MTEDGRVEPITELFRRRDQLVGTFVTVDSPVIAEVLGLAGFDFVIVDMEHTGMDVIRVQTLLQAIGNTPARPMVRVGEISEMLIKQVLDAGAESIMVPHVQSGEDAARIVRYARYAPAGIRGVTAARAAQYGLTFHEYSRRANDSIGIVAIIEDRPGFENAEEIIQTEGIDAIVAGPWDLAASLGFFGEPHHPEVEAAIEEIFRLSANAGKPVASYGESAEEVEGWRNRGADILILGEDYTLLLAKAQTELASLRTASPSS
jgi:4-hydroxy-2-oxoheptanedioate aldolase